MTSVRWSGTFGMAAVLAFGMAMPVSAQSWKLDRSTFDPSAAACSDFYEYVCGGWSRSAAIPAGRAEAQWAQGQAEARDHQAMVDLLSGHDDPRNRELARLRTFFASCMTHDAKAESADRATLDGWLGRIDAVDSPQRLMALIRDLHAAGISVFFQYSGEPDRNDRTRFRGEIHQGQLGLPAPQLYSDNRPGMEDYRKAYRDHVARMLELSGQTHAAAVRNADAVFRLETALAADSLTFAERFEPSVSEHVMTAQMLAHAAPHMEWKPYFDRVGYSGDRPLNVTSTRYLERLDKVLAETPLEDLRTFLRWQLLNALGTALPGALSDQYFQFTAGRTGQTRSPFDECQLATLKALGVELSRQYSLRVVGTDARNQARAMVERVRKQMVDSVPQTSWLSQDARRLTQQKLADLSVKVGFPDEWPETGTFPLQPNAFLQNVLAARAFEQRRAWQRAHARRSRASWEMTVYPNAAAGMAAARLVIPNGFPDISTNSIVLTAAYLRPPLFDRTAPTEVQYGTFGWMVAHELVHVLENHQYDRLGEAHELWSASDLAAHDARVGCVRDQGNQFVVFDDTHLDGNLTMDENLADFGGVAHAYAAMSRQLGGALSERGPDGFTRAQRFFITYAQSWCTAERPASARERLARDPHAPPRFRVNATLSNMPEFAAAFSCNPGSAMARPEPARCVVW